MNILMLLFKDIHLDARVQREAAALADAGYNVDIACLRERDEEPQEIHPKVNFLRIDLTTKRMKRTLHQKTEGTKKTSVILKVFRTPLLKLGKDILAQREYTRKVTKLFEDKDYQAVHCHDLNTLPTGVYLRKKYKTKLIYDSHELFNEMAGKNKIERWFGYIIEGQLIRNIDHLINVNQFSQKFMTDKYGDFPATIIQNTPILTQQATKESDYWRIKYGLSQDDVILLYQGGLTPQRGIEECIEAMNYLPERYKLILLGEGSLQPMLEMIVQKNNLANRVFFHPPVPPTEILTLTAQADIGLVMYKNTCLNNYLSTPNKIFEYFMAGIPTVASNHPGKRYIVEDIGTGVCVEETAEDISQGILKVTEKYEHYRDNCVRRRNEFSWDVEKIKLVNLYREMIGQ